MKHVLRLHVAAGASALLLLSPHPAAAERKLINAPLVWKPTNVLAELGTVNLTGIESVKIHVQAFTDNRENRQRIGENREDEDEGKVVPVATTSDVADFCTVKATQTLKDLGLDVSPEDGDLRMAGEVLQFFVVERNTYVGDVRLRLSILGKDGAVRWTGVAAGSEKRVGRSYKADNYHEVLSDSLQAAVFSLLKDDAFRAALKQP
jgi:hypothetical protein